MAGARLQVRQATARPASRLALLRTVLALHAVGVAFQAIFAGLFLSGGDGSVRWHEEAGWIVAAICLAQILIAAILRIPRKALLPFLLSSILILLAELLQAGTGYARFLSVHVPLGVFIFGGLIAQMVWISLGATE